MLLQKVEYREIGPERCKAETHESRQIGGIGQQYWRFVERSSESSNRQWVAISLS